VKIHKNYKKQRGTNAIWKYRLVSRELQDIIATKLHEVSLIYTEKSSTET